MDHAALMRLIERVGDLNRNAERFIEFERAAGRRLSVWLPDACDAAFAPLLPLAGVVRLPRSRPTCVRVRARCARERFALQVLHDDELDAGFAADVVEHADVGMLEAADRLRLALEALLQVADARTREAAAP